MEPRDLAYIGGLDFRNQFKWLFYGKLVLDVINSCAVTIKKLDEIKVEPCTDGNLLMNVKASQRHAKGYEKITIPLLKLLYKVNSTHYFTE